LRTGRDFRKVTTPNFLILFPIEGGSCSLETKQSRRKVPAAELFVSEEWHQDQRTRVYFDMEITGTKVTTLKNLS
jgi:hypothetical protein